MEEMTKKEMEAVLLEHEIAELENDVARPAAGRRRNLAVARNMLIREAHVSFDTLDGERVTGSYPVVMEFGPVSKKIAGERMYADPLFAQFITEQIGDGFTDMPGVTRIRDSAPVIDEHGAYGVAARRGLETARAAA